MNKQRIERNLVWLSGKEKTEDIREGTRERGELKI